MNRLEPGPLGRLKTSETMPAPAKLAGLKGSFLEPVDWSIQLLAGGAMNRGQPARNLEPEAPQYTKLERRGSSIAHGSALLIGVPLSILLLPVPFSLVPCPVVSYLIARSFRRRKLAWGAFQGLQASAIHSSIVIMATVVVVADLPYRLALTLGTAALLLFLYSLWAALDTLLGYDFHYIVISKFLDRVSRVNLDR
jgi:hypothetical protein